LNSADIRTHVDLLKFEAAAELTLIVGDGFPASVRRFVDCIVSAAILEVAASQQDALANISKEPRP
jgi:hypothetical protein